MSLLVSLPTFQAIGESALFHYFLLPERADERAPTRGEGACSE